METKTIRIKKSTVAQYRGVGIDVDTMAERFAITPKEMNGVLEKFGMRKSRSKKEIAPAYVILTEDDMQDVVADLTAELITDNDVENSDLISEQAGA
jgi:heat shock protein HspQ